MREAERIVQRSIEKADATAISSALSKCAERFFDSLDDDLNISGAMGQLFDLIRDSNRAMDAGELLATEAQNVLADWARINHVLTLEPELRAIPDEVLALVEQRQQARAAKNWAESDRLRDEIAKLGWVVKDTKDGPKLSQA
jgi:cysteinyl-tRNA synthetase